MKVLKFGGTSVGTVESLTNVRRIIDGLKEPSIVVVSALGGLTDKLIATAQSAAAGKEDYIENVEGFKSRHIEIIEKMIPEERRKKILEEVLSLLNELGDIYKGLSLIKSLPERTLDLVVSFGERMSSIIVAGMLKDADHHDSLNFMRTERWFNKDIADRSLTEEGIRKEFPLPLSRHAVMGGFISRDRDTGEITNLGRGGSDYSAALVAAALNADLLEIWTDVDGFLTSDPRIIKNASIINTMTFVESMELCSFGAKVIYPPTIYPVFHKSIPIKILNTFNPEAPGTYISDTHEEQCAVRGVSSLGKAAMISVEGSLAANVAEINTRSYNALARNGVGVLLVGQHAADGRISLIVTESDLEKAERLLTAEFTPDLREGYVTKITSTGGHTIIAVVGEGIKKVNGLGARLVNTLERSGIRVHTLSDGASETTIALVVDTEKASEALRLIHDAAIYR